MSILALIAALAMGFVLGLLGGGGSILAVPILVFLLGVEAKAAIATSLLVVGTTSAFAAINHARNGNVIWKTGLVFGGFAMGGAFAGGLLAAYIPGDVLLVLFALLMLITAIAMLRSKKGDVSEDDEAHAPKKLPIMKIAAEGFIVGGVTGLVGAGGGFLVVPALALLGGLSMRHAIGTSLMVIAMKSFAGFAGYAGHVEIDYALVGTFVGAAILGTVLGSQAAKAIEAAKLRKAFAYFVLIMGVFILGQKTGIIDLGQELPDDHHAVDDADEGHGSVEMVGAPGAMGSLPSIAADLIPHGHVAGSNLLTGGEPSDRQLRDVADAGFEVVVSLLPDDQARNRGLEDLAEDLGLSFVQIPVASGADLSAANVERLHQAIGDQAAVIYCASGNRAGAMVALRAAWHQGMDRDAALALGATAGLRSLRSQVEALL